MWSARAATTCCKRPAWVTGCALASRHYIQDAGTVYGFRRGLGPPVRPGLRGSGRRHPWGAALDTCTSRSAGRHSAYPGLLGPRGLAGPAGVGGQAPGPGCWWPEVGPYSESGNRVPQWHRLPFHNTIWHARLAGSLACYGGHRPRKIMGDGKRGRGRVPTGPRRGFGLSMPSRALVLGKGRAAPPAPRRESADEGSWPVKRGIDLQREGLCEGGYGSGGRSRQCECSMNLSTRSPWRGHPPRRKRAWPKGHRRLHQGGEAAQDTLRGRRWPFARSAAMPRQPSEGAPGYEPLAVAKIMPDLEEEARARIRQAAIETNERGRGSARGAAGVGL